MALCLTAARGCTHIQCRTTNPPGRVFGEHEANVRRQLEAATTGMAATRECQRRWPSGRAHSVALTLWHSLAGSGTQDGVRLRNCTGTPGPGPRRHRLPLAVPCHAVRGAAEDEARGLPSRKDGRGDHHWQATALAASAGDNTGRGGWHPSINLNTPAPHWQASTGTGRSACLAACQCQ